MIHSERVIASHNKLPFLVEGALNEIPEDTLLLDVGAGDGRLSAVLAESRPDISVVGVEYDTELALHATPDRLKNGLVIADARSLPFKAGVFETVTAINILHEVVNDSDETERLMQLNCAIAGVARVIKQDGELVLYDGLMPDNEKEQLIVRPNNESATELLVRFRDEYLARPASIEELDLPQEAFESDIASIVMFLTKYDYLKAGDAWEGERQQLYPFTNLNRIIEALNINGLEVIRVQFPEAHTRKGLQRLLANYAIMRAQDEQPYTVATFPACQMLLTARKQI